MKNILVTLVFVLFACCPHAEASGFDKPVDDYDPDTQTSGTYTFKGIPIKGTVSEFSRKLQQQGYKYEGVIPNPNKEYVGLSGKFMDKDVYIFLSGDKSSHEIYAVDVYFNDTKDYYIGTYRTIRNLLSQKYNDPYKWSIEDTRDMKEYPNIETIEAIRQGNYLYQYRIFSNNVDRPYIGLSWNKLGIILSYFNPYTLDKVMKKQDQQSMSDL